MLLSWARKQIDCGADAIWIDMLYTQAVRLAQITRDVEHPAVKESVEAAVKIVDEVHKYGAAQGRYVWVGSWDGAFALTGKFPYRPPAVDFVTVSPSVEEVLQKRLNTEHWTKRMAGIRTAYGNNVPVLAYIDWAFDDSQTVMFSQKLSKEEQRETLRNFDRAFQEAGINFVYPLHGGWMSTGPQTRTLAFGKHRFYDSLAPEFDTYETIRELARKNAEGGKR